MAAFVAVACSGIPAWCPAAHAAESDARIRPDAVGIRLSAGARAAAAHAASAATAPTPGLAALAARLGLGFESEFPATSSLRTALGSRETSNDAARSAASRLDRDWVVHLKTGVDPAQAVEALRQEPDVEAAWTIAWMPLEWVPDDSLFSKAYYFFQPSRHDSHAPEAWDITTGDSTQIIAIIDSGVLFKHPDLGGVTPGSSGNLWTNPIERDGLPGVDDDGNGYVDDVHGWDFVSLPFADIVVDGEDWRDEDPDPNDFLGHGTAVAGLAGGITGNHIGVAGVAGGARILPLRAGFSAREAPSGLIDLSSAARAVAYAARLGATVINCSFASVRQQDMTDALDLAYALGTVVVVAAGNNDSSHDMAERPEVISVAALDAGDQVTAFSNRGDYVDLAAAGLFVATTSLMRVAGADSASRCQPDYAVTASGTSFASPLVAGAVALVQSHRHAIGLPPLDPANMRLRLVETADDISSANPGLTGYGSGRVDYARALTDPQGSFALRLPGAMVGGSPAVVPTRSGSSSVIAATGSGHLVSVNGSTGAVSWEIPLAGAPVSCPSAADFDGDIGVFVALGSGDIAGVDLSGHPLPGWPVHPGGMGTLPPAIADIDGDGSPDVVWANREGQVFAFHADGRAVSGFPVRVAPQQLLAPALCLADLDDDHGAAEIVAAQPSGEITVIDGDGSIRPGWPRTLLLCQTPIVARLSATGPPIVAVTSSTILELLDAHGDLVWSGGLGDYATGSPAAADLDGDGVDEIMVLLASGDVAVVGSDHLPRRVSTRGTSVSPFEFGAPEMLGGRWGASSGGFAWAAGGSLWWFQEPLQRIPPLDATSKGTPTIADLDGDGLLEAVVQSPVDPMMVVYRTRLTASASAGWFTSRGNVARTASTTTTAAPVADDVGPEAIHDLEAHEEALGVTLRWTAPADVGGGHVSRYEIRLAEQPIDAAVFDRAAAVEAPAPLAAGLEQMVQVADLVEGHDDYFAIRALDQHGNRSALSNVVHVAVPAIAPAAVSDLRIADASAGGIALAWTATGDDGHAGLASAYEVRAATHPIDAPSFDTAGVAISVPGGNAIAQRARFSGLVLGRRYWFATRAIDDAGLQSPLSNVVSTVMGPLAAHAGIGLAPRTTPASGGVDLFWQRGVSPIAEPGRIDIFDVGGRQRRTLELPHTADGVVSWDGWDESGHRMTAGVYFARLTLGREQAFTRIVLRE